MKKKALAILLFWGIFIVATPVFGDSFTVTADGSVGIGTTESPEATLDVKGTAVFGNNALVITEDDCIGIGTAVVEDIRQIGSMYVPSKVHIKGNLKVEGLIEDRNGLLTEINIMSDARLKKNITPIDKALKKVCQLSGVSFNWRDRSYGSALEIGVIAQEVEKIFPDIVHTKADGYKRVDYNKLVAPLIEAVKELKTEISTLKTDNELLADQNELLATENQALKADLQRVFERLDALEKR